MKKLFVLSLGVFLATTLRSEVVLANVFARNVTSLNGDWHYIVDPYDTGYYDYRRNPYDRSGKVTGGYALDQQPQSKADLVEYNFDTAPTLKVPGDWNSQKPELLYYEGSVWYRTKFDLKEPAPGGRLFLHFGAANYSADIYLNGKKVGQHIGGFTPFACEITDAVQPTNNSLVVRVNNNRFADAVPTVNTDWWNYGGLTRDVLLVETPATFISNYLTRLKPGTTNVIEVQVALAGPDKAQTVNVSFPSLKIAAEMKPDTNGLARFEIAPAELPLWSPEKPVLNDVLISAGKDSLKDKVGFRTVATSGKELLVNGRKTFLRGICIHEEMPLEGRRAWSEADARQLLTWAKELNCNFVRLAHYPHNEHMARVADEMGILCWEEIPVYWTIQWTNPATLANAKAQLKDLVTRDQNRASVIIWSVANETPVGPERTRFLKALVDEARALDNTRLVSAAMEVHSGTMENRPGAKPEKIKIVDDPFGESTDLCSFNQYTGWYGSSLDVINQTRWQIKYNKPVFISEFGADCKAGLHGESDVRFTEEYQAELYRRTLQMLDQIPGFSGCTPWILCDFRSPRRPLTGIQDGWNIKGLIGHNGQKKQAFEVLKNYYAEKAAAAAAK